MLYRKIIFPLLARADAEKTHYAIFGLMHKLFSVPGIRTLTSWFYTVRSRQLERTVAGLTFKNPVGLAAGFDKNASFLKTLTAFGFGFIEIGTVTPLAQSGNDKPRLFRILADDAIINRMGFNNDGAVAIADRLKTFRKNGLIVGGNIGKNKITPIEEANNDYLKAFEALYAQVDYFVVNVSSPNTPGLRTLQDKEPLLRLLQLVQERNQQKPQPKPIFLKIAPDLTNEQLDDIVEIATNTKLSGVIATNTTILRSGLTTPSNQIEKLGAGGLSGKPLTNRSTEVIRYLAERAHGAWTIIGVGGIFTAADAIEKIKAGATLVQVYTGFIYQGPSLVKKINKAILKQL